LYYLEDFNTDIAVIITFIRHNETYKGTERKQFPPFSGQEGYVSQRKLEGWNIGNPDPRDCKRFTLRTGSAMPNLIIRRRRRRRRNKCKEEEE